MLYELGDSQWNIPALRELLETLVPRRRCATTSSPRSSPSGRARSSSTRPAWPADPTLILLTIGDVTTKHRAFDRLTQADRQKDEFLAMLAHELRNPMAPMTERGAPVAALKAPTTRRRHKASRLIERQCRPDVRMVDDLLDVSRISRGMVVAAHGAPGPVADRAAGA